MFSQEKNMSVKGYVTQKKNHFLNVYIYKTTVCFIRYMYECYKCFLTGLTQNKIRMIYLCFHEDLIDMHTLKPEVTLYYHIWKCYTFGSQSLFGYIENV